MASEGGARWGTYLNLIGRVLPGDIMREYDILDKTRSEMPASSPVPLFQPLRPRSKEAILDIYECFALSAKPDYFITSRYADKSPKGLVYWSDDYCGDGIQKLEYSVTDNTLPRYIFQLGSVILPGDDIIETEALPFTVVVDMLDPMKAVWLIHSSNVEEDPEEEEPWRPSFGSLIVFRYLFENIEKSRKPKYNIAQIARTFGEWTRASWEQIQDSLMETRREVEVTIGLVSKAELGAATTIKLQNCDKDLLCKGWDLRLEI